MLRDIIAMFTLLPSRSGDWSFSAVTFIVSKADAWVRCGVSIIIAIKVQTDSQWEAFFRSRDPLAAILWLAIKFWRAFITPDSSCFFGPLL